MEIFRLAGSIFIDNSEANRSISATSNNAQGLGTRFGSVAKKAAKLGAAIGAAALTAASAIGVKAVNAAIDFEKQMANVATLLDGDVKTKISNLGTNVKSLATSTGVSTELLTDGLYQVISAFGDTTDSMNILETAAKGAKAGNATVTDSVNLLSAVTKGYGDTSSEAAEKASDLAFLTVKLGQTTFPELASSMGKVIPLAGSLKVSQEELFGAMATLTGVTGGTAEVSTQLRATLQSLMKPSKDMQEALNSMGYESGAAALESLGFQGVLNSLKGSVDNNDVAFSNMFSSVEAGTAALALTGSQADNFTQKTNAMKNAVGSTDEAFKKQQATVSAMMEKINTSFNAILITLGEKVLPKFQKFLDWVILHMPEIQKGIENAFKAAEKAIKKCKDAVKSLTDFFEKHWDIIQPILAGIAAGALTFGVYTLAINAAAIATGIWTTVTGVATVVGGAFAAVIAFITSPIGLVVIAIGLLVAAGVWLYKNWDTVIAKGSEFLNWLKELALKVVQFGKNIVMGLWQGISDMSRWINDKILGFIGGIGKTIKDFFGIASPSKLMAEYGKNISEGLANGILENAKKAGEAAKQLSQAVVSNLNKLGNAITTALKNQYAQQEKAQKDSYDKRIQTLKNNLNFEITQLKNANAKKLQEYLKDYNNQQNVISGKYNPQIAAAQAEIDAIENRTSVEEEELRKSDYSNKLHAKQQELLVAETEEAKATIQKEIKDMIEEENRRLLLRERQDRIRELNQKIQDLNDNKTQELELEKQKYDEKVRLAEEDMQKEIERKTLEKKQKIKDYEEEILKMQEHYKTLNSEESLQAEARRLALDGNNAELIKLLETYNPSWQNAGQSFGESLLNGLNSMKTKIQTEVNNILAMVDSAKSAQNQVIINAKQAWASANAAGDTEGMAQAHAIAEAARAAGGTIPAYANGTNYVPYDQIALVHKGEKIIPANRNNGGVTVVINNPTIMNDKDADKFGDLMVRRLKALGVT